MAFNREKYKTVPLSTVQGTVKETKQFDTYFGQKDKFPSFWKKEEGVTLKRVLPAHEPGDSPYVPMKTSQLPIEIEKKNEAGDVIGKEIKNKKVFIGTLHGGLPFDIIEEYIKRVYEQAEQVQDKEDKSKFLAPITGFRPGKGAKWVWGIRPQTDYVFYALIDGKICRDVMNPKQMEDLNKESANLCEQNDIASIDMFSDPSQGFPISWENSKDENGKAKTTVKAAPPKMSQSWDSFFVQHTISDKVLEELETYPSLKKLYVNSYGRHHFELALEGLKRFDEANVYKIFADEEFLDKVEEFSRLVDELENSGISKEDDELPFEEKPLSDNRQGNKSNFIKKKSPGKAVTKVVSDSEKLECVNSEFIRQYGEGYEELDLTGSELEEAFRLAVKGEDLGYDIPHVQNWITEEEPQPEDGLDDPHPEVSQKDKDNTPGVVPPIGANSSTGMSAKERIAAMRAKQK